MDNNGGLIGTTIDNYLIESLVKETKRTLAFRAHHLILQRDDLLKVLKPDQGEERKAQILEEGTRLVKIQNHRNLPIVYSAGKNNGHVYIAMELIDNGEGDLQDAVDSGRRFSLHEISGIMIDTTNAVVDLHNNGILHRDIKLKNMKRRKDGEGYVLDLGGRLSENDYNGDIPALGDSFRELLACCDERIPRRLEQIVKAASEEGYKTITEFRDAIESYKREITRRKFLIITGSALAFAGLSYIGFKHLNYKSSIGCIVDEIGKVDATDYKNIKPLFNELLLRIIDHKIDWLVESGKIPKGKFPYATIENGSWFLTSDGYWSEGFWPGILWMAHEVTDDKRYRDLAIEWTKDIKLTEKDKTTIRSIRFYYSHARAYGLTHDKFFRENALKAAEFMASRFNEVGGFIQPGGEIDTTLGDKKVNVELMTIALPILWWAYDETKSERYYDIILKHVNTTQSFNVREDGSVRRWAVFDSERRILLGEENDFGYKDNSCHSRSQARAIHGFTLAYQQTGYKSFLTTAEKLANYFIDNLPEDFVPFYDFDDPNANIPKDSSTAAIASSALLDLHRITGNEKYKLIAYQMLKSLSSKRYLSLDLESYQGIVMHSCSNMNTKEYTDSSLIYGDYYFLKNLRKINKI